MKKNIFNIALDKSFLDEIALCLLQEVNFSSEQLSEYLLLLPNKRLIKNLQEAFLRATQGKALLLPKMISIAELDYIISNPIQKDLDTSQYFQKVITKRQRAFILLNLVQKIDGSISTYQALDLAESLGQIIDEAYLQEVSFDNLEEIAPENLAEHWQKILKFLHIVTEFWPQYLQEHNAIDATNKQVAIYKLQAQEWILNPPTSKIVALNILSYYPSIINLLNVVKNLDAGRLFFYGIDTQKSVDDFSQLTYSHPQKVFACMFGKLNIIPTQIFTTTGLNYTIKESLIHRIFDHEIYKNFENKQVADAVQGISCIVAKNEEEEAKTIALALREVLESPKKTAGLISNNSSVIKRVMNELLRWGIKIDDYIGTPLYNSLQAKLFMLVGELLSSDFDCHILLGILKHPFTKLQGNRLELWQATMLLDRYILRHSITETGLNYLIKETKKSIQKQPQLREPYNLLLKLQNLVESFPDISKPQKFNDFLYHHILLAENMVASAENQLNDLFSEQEGKELSMLLSSLMEESQDMSLLYFADYLNIVEHYILQSQFRQTYNKHARLYIYGSLQSNLIHHDLMIISSVNERSMPSIANVNPWVNKSMMQQLGFIPQENLIGLQANYFAQYLCSTEVLLTRSIKSNNELSTASRWWLKFTTLLEYYGIFELSSKSYLYDIQGQMDIPHTFHLDFVKEPTFNPNIERRPTQLSATNIEKLMKNPYEFFVNKVLNLRPLDNISQPFNKALYGTVLHGVFELFFLNVQKYQGKSSMELFAIIHKIALKEFHFLSHNVSFKMFYEPKINYVLQEFLENQIDVIANIKSVSLEIEGTHSVNVAGITLTLTGKADRIDISNNHDITIVDYKTTSKKGSTQHKLKEYQYQLAILTWILEHNGFPNIADGFNSVEAQYLFLPNKYQKEHIEIVQNDYSIQPVIATLEKYYKDVISYNFTDNKDIDKAYLHFARFEEWNKEVIDQEEDSND